MCIRDRNHHLWSGVFRFDLAGPFDGFIRGWRIGTWDVVQFKEAFDVEFFRDSSGFYA